MQSRISMLWDIWLPKAVLKFFSISQMRFKKQIDLMIWNGMLAGNVSYKHNFAVSTRFSTCFLDVKPG